MSPTFFAPAKINLWLRIFAPDATGYHPLDTLFCALDLSDEIVIATEADGIRLTVAGADVGPAENNLAYRAALEFFLATGTAPRAQIHLTKRVPAGAGLGGGSSDAATVLFALNALHGYVLPTADMLAMAARLGSDVPFFLCGSRFAHATGRGERLQGMPPLPSAPVVVIAPSFGVGTADAYRWLDQSGAYSESVETEPTIPRTWDDVASVAHNDFERVLFARHPVLASMRDALRESGAKIALLSGSGSALFGVFGSTEARDRAAPRLQAKFAEASVLRAATLA